MSKSLAYLHSHDQIKCRLWFSNRK